MLNATVTQKIHVTEDLIILLVQPDGGVSDFHPGQYVALGLPGSAPRPAHFPAEATPPAPDKLIKRAYSIGSSPLEKGYLEFYIAVVPEGALTSRLALIEEGDRIYVAPKITGHFTIHHLAPAKNLVFVATGTGVAPFVSMLRTPETWAEERKISLIHGVRFARDLGYRDELLNLAATRPNFTYHAVTSREPGAADIRKGYVQHLFEDSTLALVPETDHVFLCGNPAMIDDVEKLLGTRGYIPHSKKQPGNLHYEKYW